MSVWRALLLIKLSYIHQGKKKAESHRDARDIWIPPHFEMIIVLLVLCDVLHIAGVSCVCSSTLLSDREYNF